MFITSKIDSSGTRVIPGIDEDWSDYKVHFSSEFDIDIPENMRRSLHKWKPWDVTLMFYVQSKRVLCHTGAQMQPLFHPEC